MANIQKIHFKAPDTASIRSVVAIKTMFFEWTDIKFLIGSNEKQPPF